jgi:hypothetical protein
MFLPQDTAKERSAVVALVCDTLHGNQQGGGPSMTLIKSKVDELFAKVLSQPDGHVYDNPVTGGRFLKGESGEDGIAYQKHEAAKALLAQEWFTVYGPPNAPLLPLRPGDWDNMRYGRIGGLPILVGSYARSLSFRDWVVHNHPSFEDFACGLMVFPDIRARASEDPLILKRYPPRVLVGMLSQGAFWERPDGGLLVPTPRARRGPSKLRNFGVRV